MSPHEKVEQTHQMYHRILGLPDQDWIVPEYPPAFHELAPNPYAYPGCSFAQSVWMNEIMESIDITNENTAAKYFSYAEV